MLGTLNHSLSDRKIAYATQPDEEFSKGATCVCSYSYSYSLVQGRLAPSSQPRHALSYVFGGHEMRFLTQLGAEQLSRPVSFKACFNALQRPPGWASGSERGWA